MLKNLPAWLRLNQSGFLFERFRELWAEDTKEVQPISPEKYLESMFMFDLLAKNKHLVHVLVDSKRFKILYVSESVEAFCGYTRAEFEERNMLLFFERIQFQHLPFFFHVIRWLRLLRQKGPVEVAAEHICFYSVGLKMRTKSGETLRLLTKTSQIETEKTTGTTGLVLVTLENIAPLMKGEGYWARMEAGKSVVYHSSFFSDDVKFTARDVISDREKEIVHLIAAGLESKEIAERLFISSATVDKHRKNIIARLGARDSVALLEICRMCNIV